MQPFREKKYEERKLHVSRFNSYVVTLAATGQIEKARSVIERLRKIKPKFPPGARKSGVEFELRQRKEDFDTNVQRVLPHELRRRARLSETDIKRVLGERAE